MLETLRRWVKAQQPFLFLSLSHKGKAETTPTTWAAVASEVQAGLQSKRLRHQHASLHLQGSRGF